MKKLAIVLSAVCIIMACNRKTAPAGGERSATKRDFGKSGNTGSNTNTAAPNTTPTFDNRNNNNDVRIPVSMELGKSTFVGKCGTCHALKQAGNYTKNQWGDILKVMTVRAKLTQAETDAVTAYLMANAK
jgi:mono/diheme cytochrome c family protein